ncbi:MAG: hypothetical protein P8X82_13390 [Gemmatimonadales bacterium]
MRIFRNVVLYRTSLHAAAASDAFVHIYAHSVEVLARVILICLGRDPDNAEEDWSCCAAGGE